jgi:hypothetical protein
MEEEGLSALGLKRAVQTVNSSTAQDVSGPGSYGVPQTPITPSAQLMATPMSGGTMFNTPSAMTPTPFRTFSALGQSNDAEETSSVHSGGLQDEASSQCSDKRQQNLLSQQKGQQNPPGYVTFLV